MKGLTQVILLLPYLCGFFEMQGHSLSVIGLSGSFPFCLRQQQKVRHSLCELVPETFVDPRATGRREVSNLELTSLPFCSYCFIMYCPRERKTGKQKCSCWYFRSIGLKTLVGWSQRWWSLGKQTFSFFSERLISKATPALVGRERNQFKEHA